MSKERDSRVYVGNLPPDVRSNELEQMFDKYGKVLNVNLKNGPGRGPPFAFIEYEDYRDAEDAVRAKHGANYDGYSIRVEHPHGGRDGGGRGQRGPPPRGPPRYDDRRGGGYYGGGGGGGYRGGGGYDRGYDRGNGYRDGGYDRERRRSPPQRKHFKVLVTGFPESTTVSELRKHMKDAGDVVNADIRDGKGYIEYDNNEDFRYAIKKVTGTEIETADGDKSKITVKEDKGGSRSRSRSPVRRKRSPSYSPDRRSRSRS